MTKVFILGWALAAIFWAYSISWIFDAVNYYGAGTALSLTISFLLVGYVSIYFGLFLVALKFFRNSNYRPFIFASTFFILEWFRSWVITGFPWLNLGMLSEYLWGALPMIGVSGTSFLIVLIISLLFEKKHTLLNRGAAGLILVFLLFGPGHYQKSGQDTLDLTIIQPLDTNLSQIIKMTNDAESNLVIWPEAVASYDQNLLAKINNKNVIGGFFRKQGKDFYTSAINLETGHYFDKENLVPFGEFQPLGNMLSSFNKFFNIPNSNLKVGNSIQDKADWSALICWELVFNDTFTKRVKGSGYIIHMSNDKWYGESMPRQHLKHAKARAVESNKWVVRSTLDGISQFISPRSEESSAKLERGVQGSITKTIYLNYIDTAYVKYGDLPLLIISFVFLLIGLKNRRNEK